MDALLSFLGSIFPCLPNFGGPSISIKNNLYKIVRLLGEGGYSYVYLVSLKSNSHLYYALKKIRCPMGTRDYTYKNALRELRNYKRFGQSPYVIQSIEERIMNDADDSSTIYILMPYFEQSLQDIITQNVLLDKLLPEEEVLQLFVGICRGVQTLHKFKKRATSSHSDTISHDSINDEEEGLLPTIGESEVEDAFDGSTELEEFSPYAHRDLKPANVMISPEGLPVLIDLGSCSKARVTVLSRQQALQLTEFAQEHCTLPYRAPELLDVSSNAVITEATDIWSLGCLMYCACFGYSPFEKMELDEGANLTVAISAGKFKYPSGYGNYSPELIQVINDCLQLDSNKRPTIDQLIERCLDLLRR
ncbi:uncharacterized protein KQ657_002757 [Scheffersomyces spartinae]|uniref:non-specific serine/threonine protein kinase n=1 Tax=Scheffersomyces spartinae TaxID=45513 RepID=A0A9P7V5S4_9ASCO|nr:uncharacterized protein KQ657_002757 [Scheffersomyces spartinae]KAG7191792.1 hypothetical protein KQ657_002757 [Scheffersomyces spartinae]